jgi:hypothetical protein
MTTTMNPCRGCGSLLVIENFVIADGCPCNSARGINHGLVPVLTCTCAECDPGQTGSVRRASQMTAASTPAPCWHCGSERTFVCEIKPSASPNCVVWCQQCGSVSPKRSTLVEALAAWNERAIEDALRAEVDRLRKALEEIGLYQTEVAILCAACSLAAGYCDQRAPNDDCPGRIARRALGEQPKEGR